MFTQLTNRCAFIDTVVIGTNGSKRKAATNLVAVRRNVAIGGKGSHYARVVDANCVSTGNPVQLKYAKRGRISQFKAVPTHRLILHSEKRPVTAAEAGQTLQGFMCAGSGAQVYRVELTFDLTGISPESFVAWSLASGSRKLLRFGIQKTAYLGSTRSVWSARIYAKNQVTTRVEFVLRPTFLRQHGIQRIEDLLRLRTIPVVDLLCLKTLQPDAVEYKQRAFEALSRDATYLHQMLRDAKRNAASTLIDHPICAVLKSMQQMLIW